MAETFCQAPAESSRENSAGLLAFAGLPQQQVGDVGLRWDNNKGRNTEFAHYSSFDIRRPAAGHA